MQISALIGCSTPTYFINSGDRYNGGIPDRSCTYFLIESDNTDNDNGMLTFLTREFFFLF
jgi:hypothetical protein